MNRYLEASDKMLSKRLKDFAETIPEGDLLEELLYAASIRIAVLSMSSKPQSDIVAIWKKMTGEIFDELDGIRKKKIKGRTYVDIVDVINIIDKHMKGAIE